MNNKILLLKSPLKEVIWGNTYFKDKLKLTDEDKKFGEYWTLSGYSGNASIIKNGMYEGESLDLLYKEHKELFLGSTSKEFPILIKIISTSDDLSVQVHPNDEYARKDGDLGKTESWLILKASDNSKIVYGHKAKTKEELIEKIENNKYEELLNYKEVKEGMFVKVNAGTIHALGKGLVLLEVQQSSNLTYRVYDYNRHDKNGKPRELHVKKALDVIKVPDMPELNEINYLSNSLSAPCILWDNDYFKIELLNINQSFEINNIDEKYYLVTVVSGTFEYEKNLINLGDSFIITSKCEHEKINGNGKIVIVSSYK